MEYISAYLHPHYNIYNEKSPGNIHSLSGLFEMIISYGLGINPKDSYCHQYHILPNYSSHYALWQNHQSQEEQ